MGSTTITVAPPPTDVDRVLIVPSNGADGPDLPTLLAPEGVPCVFCPTVKDLCREAATGAAVVVLPADGMTNDARTDLSDLLRDQPPWSDLPVIALLAPDGESATVSGMLAALGPMTFVPMSAPPAVFVSVVRAALRDRRRQYAARDQLRERNQTEEVLREADRRKDEFIALLAHELRNPLAPIRNGLQVIRLADDRRVRERAQEVMDRQLAHMVRLIDDLLDVSRISRNKMELRRGRIPLSAAVSNAVETARPLIDAAGHDLTVTLPSDPIILDADLTRLSQVFANLLTNSARYTEPGGRIWLTATVGADEPRPGDGRPANSPVTTDQPSTSPPSEVLVSVKDTGIGIPADALPTVFDRFTQVDRSIERSTGGLGIGLALVKGLVEMHGGTVTASSPGPGQGSEFVVRLPTLSGGQLAPADGAEPNEHGRRILVVDDNHDSAATMAEMLRMLGNDVQTAHDGVEAVELAERFQPEIVFMDVGMPRLNGLDATRRIREQDWGRGITIIALTGWGQSGDRERTQDAGCDGHLVKPVSFAALESALAEPRRAG